MCWPNWATLNARCAAWATDASLRGSLSSIIECVELLREDFETFAWYASQLSGHARSQNKADAPSDTREQSETRSHGASESLDRKLGFATSALLAFDSGIFTERMAMD